MNPGVRTVLTTVVLVGSLTASGCAGPPAAAPGTAGDATPPATPTPATATPSASVAAGSEDEGGTRIRITIGDETVTGVLRDSATSRSLIEQLPLTLDFEDLNSVEKIARPPMELSMDDMPEGDDPQPNDIGYYAPSGHLVFYYGDVGYWDGIARIGEFTSDIAPIESQTGAFTATVELAE